MPRFPQAGGCLCGELRYAIGSDPLTVYACHCTDCQRMTAASCSLAVLVESGALERSGATRDVEVRFDDGRVKRSTLCGRCDTRVFAPSRASGRVIVEGGTLDDTSWLRPAGHIWTRSAQPWLALPEDALRFEAGPDAVGFARLVRAWQERRR